ncbi:hypothetical protein O3M35_011039 [Rhynocoris fuscipes]|uniref:Uncharacterized protein n=1 Tax=Rhynocoris fuscipes TaxID=488301 RepID=A0AAW1CUT3_9HEMI
MGPKVCIYEDVCIRHANPAMRSEQIDWEQLFKNYGRWPKNNGDYYLLSVFMGDIVGSATLCRQLAKRGRSCYNTRTPPAMPTLYEQSAMSSPVLPALYQLTPPTSSSAVNSYPPYSTAYYATGQYLSTS